MGPTVVQHRSVEVEAELPHGYGCGSKLTPPVSSASRSSSLVVVVAVMVAPALAATLAGIVAGGGNVESRSKLRAVCNGDGTTSFTGSRDRSVQPLQPLQLQPLQPVQRAGARH